VTLNEIVEAIRTSGRVTLTAPGIAVAKSASASDVNNDPNNPSGAINTVVSPNRRATAPGGSLNGDMSSPRMAVIGDASTPLSVKGNGKRKSATVRAFPVDDDNKSNASTGAGSDEKTIDAATVAALKREKNKLQLESQRRAKQQSKKEEKEQVFIIYCHISISATI
jgi:hypothetical protein